MEKKAEYLRPVAGIRGRWRFSALAVAAGEILNKSARVGT